MRISEVFALSKEDIDFENKRIYVRRKLVYAEKKQQEMYASNLVNCGVNIKVAQELLRHANINTTMNIYTHINQDLKTEAIYTAFPVKYK